MPATRLHTSLAVTFTIVLSLIFLPSINLPSVYACPVMPQPLRALYTSSERIVVASVGQSVLVKNSEEHGSQLMRTAMIVSETLKGESHEPVVYVNRWTWEPAEGESASDEATLYEPGNTLLLFLKRSQQNAGYEISNPLYGIKQVPEADLKIYVKRLNELASIMRQQPQPHTGDLVEWLVRCAEEPATRWEGAYELAMSVMALDRKKSGKNNQGGAGGGDVAGDVAPSPPTAEIADGATVASASSSAAPLATGQAAAVNASEDANTEPGAAGVPAAVDDQVSAAQVAPPPVLESDIDASFAAHLTAAHKERLTAALFNTETLKVGDFDLIHLAIAWKDERLVPFLMAQLGQGDAEHPPEHAAAMMEIIASALSDPAIREIAQTYSSTNAYDEVYGSDPVAEGRAAGTVEPAAGSEGEVESEEAAQLEAARLEAAEKIVIYKRHAILQQFLARLANATAQNNAGAEDISNP